MNLNTWKGRSLEDIWEIKIKGTFHRLFLSKVYKIFAKSVTKVSDKRWAKAQKGELNFHKDNDYRLTEEFNLDTKLLFESFGFEASEFQNKVILDLGCGSKLRTKYFQGANIIAIDPLIDDYRKLEHCDVDDAYKVYSIGLEIFIPKLQNSADYGISINVLDHCFDFEKCVDNIYRYLKNGAKAFISFDCHFYTDALHPLILTEDVCTPIFNKCGFQILRFSEGHSGAYKKKIKNNSYGHGVSCLNYWVQKLN